MSLPNQNFKPSNMALSSITKDNSTQQLDNSTQESDNDGTQTPTDILSNNSTQESDNDGPPTPTEISDTSDNNGPPTPTEIENNNLLKTNDVCPRKRKQMDTKEIKKSENKRRKLNETFRQLQSQINETLDITERANERYLEAKKEEKQQRQRANVFQTKNEDLHQKLKQNHTVLLKMFDE